MQGRAENAFTGKDDGKIRQDRKAARKRVHFSLAKEGTCSSLSLEKSLVEVGRRWGYTQEVGYFVPFRVCLLWLDSFRVDCPASNNGGCVTSDDGILAPPGDVNEDFMEDAFFSPVTVTTPSAETVNTRKSPG